MYIKVSTGGSFSAAAQYNETGLSEAQQKQKAGQVRYLDGYNLLADDAPGIAAEMGAVASRSRTQQPVWNVSFSVGDGQSLTDQQWLGVVERYMKEIGTSTDRHQVAVWRHSDTGRDHIHALINAVPTDGERALKRYQCGIRAKQAAQQIDTSLAQPIQKGIGIREVLGEAIRTTLQVSKPTTFDELVADLKQIGITAIIKPNAAGGGGTNFQLGDHKPVKGSAVGYKFAELARQLEANRAEYQAEIERLKRGLEEAEIKPAEQIEVEKIVKIIQRDPADIAEIDRLTERETELLDQLDVNYDAWEDEKARADEAEARPVETVEVEKRVEIIKRDPADVAEIERLKKRETELIDVATTNHTAWEQEKARADEAEAKPAEQIEVIKEVEIIRRDPADVAEIERLDNREMELINKVNFNYRAWEKEKATAEKADNELQKERNKPAQQVIQHVKDPDDQNKIDRLEIENEKLKKALDLQTRDTASFVAKFNLAPTPAQIRALQAEKTLYVAGVGAVWKSGDQWKHVPLKTKDELPKDLMELTPARIAEWRPEWERYVKNAEYGKDRSTKCLPPAAYARWREKDYLRGISSGPDRKMCPKELRTEVKSSVPTNDINQSQKGPKRGR